MQRMANPHFIIFSKTKNTKKEYANNVLCTLTLSGLWVITGNILGPIKTSWGKKALLKISKGFIFLQRGKKTTATKLPLIHSK